MQLNVGGPGDFGMGFYSLKGIPGTTGGLTMMSDREYAEQQIATTPASRLAEVVKGLTGQWMESAAGTLAIGQAAKGKTAGERFQFGAPVTERRVSPIATAATYGITPKPARNRAGEDEAERAFLRGKTPKAPGTVQVNAATGFTIGPTATAPIKPAPSIKPTVAPKPDASKDDAYVPPKYYAPKPVDLPGLIKGNQPKVHL